MEKGVPKGTDVFLHRFERPVQVEVFEEHTRVVAFREGPRYLVQALQPIAHQLCLAQFLHHRRCSPFGLFVELSPPLPPDLSATEHSFYASCGVVGYLRGSRPPVHARLIHPMSGRNCLKSSWSEVQSVNFWARNTQEMKFCLVFVGSWGL